MKEGITFTLMTFSEQNFQSLCLQLAKKEPAFDTIISKYGFPPMWSRPASFATLIHIILEQQVSLASAKAAFEKLKEKIGTITPQKLLQLTDEELRACYFSRQKTIYARLLAEALVQRKLSLKKIGSLDNDAIRDALKKMKGIGDWTVDVYLLFALQRADVFPVGDLAMVNAMKELKRLPKHTSKEELIIMAEGWRPHRSIATMLMWHHYICSRGIKV